jgi:hypothetical protein
MKHYCAADGGQSTIIRARKNNVKVIPQFCIAHFYCAHLIIYNFIHYTYRLKKYHFMTILCYFKTSLVTFVQRKVYLFTCILRFNATIP